MSGLARIGPHLADCVIQWRLNLGKGLMSGAIAWFGAGSYSHVDVVTPHGTLRGARSDWYAGIPPGYQDRPIEYCRGKLKRCTQLTLPVTRNQYDRYWDFSDAQVGKPYDSRGLLESFVLGIQGKRRNWREDDSWWCSEEVAANLEYARIITKLPVTVNTVEPGDCAFILCGAGASWRDLELI